jgi:hypothetical protein
MMFYCLVVCLLGAVSAKGKDETYHVRSLDRVRMVDPSDFIYTHSDDGASTALPKFLLDIFKTKGTFHGVTLPVVRMAMNKFLWMELNATYAPSDELVSVGTEILTNKQTQSPTNVKGTELAMIVTLTFDYQPSPSFDDLNSTMFGVMQNLEYFVSNLTSFVVTSNTRTQSETDQKKVNQDLNEVTVAYRREFPTEESPTASPVATNEVKIDPNPNQVNESKDNVAASAVPATLVAATLIALIVYLVFRRKGKEAAESPKGDMMYVDVENDLYSMDRSLESSQSPLDTLSPNGDSIQYSMSADGSHLASSADGSHLAGDSVFSGIDSPTSLVNHKVGTTKSLMSGFTNASASTIRVSNINERPAKLLSTPKSLSMAAHGSLFAFSEDVGAYDDDDYDLSDRDSPKMADPPSLTKSDVSDSSEETPGASKVVAPSPSETSSCLEGAAIEQPPSVLGGRHWCGSEPGSSGHVLADLAVLASTRGESPRDPTPTAMDQHQHSATTGKARDPTPSNAISYNPFNCNPIMPAGSEPVTQLSLESSLGQDQSTESAILRSTEASPTSYEYSAKVTRKPVGDNPLIGGSEKDTPLKRNVLASRRPSANSAMTTPLKRNTSLASTPPRSNGSERSPMDGDGEEAPGRNIGGMSAKATQLFGMFGAADAQVPAGSRSRASTMDGGSKPGTPRSSTKGSRVSTPTGSRTSTPTKERASSRPVTPQGGKVGGHWLSTKFPGRAAASMPLGGDDYLDNLSRPSTPGGEFDSSLQVSDYIDESCLPFGKIVDKAPPAHNDDNEPEGLYPGYSGGRRHAGNKLGGDGTAMYQTNAMQPLDWSYKDADVTSVGDSTISDNEDRQYIFAPGKYEPRNMLGSPREPKTPLSEAGSTRTGGTGGTGDSSHASASRQLIDDLVWLEKKIADVKQTSTSALVESDVPPAIDTVDSLSYVSKDNDEFVSDTSNEGSRDEEDPTVSTTKNDSVMSSIVCRDCYAPPGKLHIVIHSTKDGPAVHTVKNGSSLEGHIFPGDLIISVDNVDTRSFTAEQVMKMMASKSDRERKITVLHFEEDD